MPIWLIKSRKLTSKLNCKLISTVEGIWKHDSKKKSNKITEENPDNWAWK